MDFIYPMTKIIFGDGSSTTIGAVLESYRAEKVFCIYDKGVKEAGIVDPIVEAMHMAGYEVVEWDGAQVSVPYSTVMEASKIAADEHIDTLVAIGGGSAMDTGKAVNVALTQPGEFERYVGILDAGLLDGTLMKPYICIPTTAGTGSEVSNVAVVYDEEAGVKKALPQPEITPTAAIIDPLLHVNMPPSLTASTGLDALAHAIEGIGGVRRNPMMTSWGMTVCDLVFTNLPRAMANGKDLEAREHMAMAATFGILVGSYAGFHLGHALGHSIEAVTHVPHGITCAFALPEICEWYADEIPEETKKMAAMLGVEVAGRPIADVGKDFKQALRTFYLDLNCPKTGTVIPDPSDIDRIIELALGEYTYITATKRPSRAQLTEILEAACESLR
ncbi:MAG TPA: iron-containing alcohol dehydrogenase [Deltaproteobacteria bacterium]|nr:iron-containing alcohol dehydrogenase [Deltaproteobacteria bacterium]